jgi:hypothetical protein
MFMLRTALPLLLLCAYVDAQTTSTITVNGVATASTAGSGLAVMATGTATLTGFGTAQLVSSGTIPSLSGIVTTTPIATSVTMIFSTGDALSGQLVVPAGYLIPQLGQSSSGAASFTITGGSGGFLNASGFFPNLTVTSTPNGNSGASIQASGSGTILLPSSHVAGTPSYTGSFAHFASGAGWETIITLVNKGSTNAQAQVNFYDESGNPSTVPLDFPQGAPAESSAAFTTTIKPGAVVVIESQGGATLSVGSAQLLADNKVSGFLIFRYQPTVQEAAVNLQVQNSSTYTLPFDNTSGIATGIALSVTTATSATVPILVQDDQGNLITTDTITLPGRGHTSFVLGTRYPAAGAVRGTIQFQAPAGAEIGVIGIRALPSGAYTTIPPIGN